MISRDFDKERLFTRRAFIFGGLKASLFLTLVGRMYYLQIMKGQDFKTQADDNRILVRPLYPKRGIIYDRNGEVLAKNERNFQLYIVKEKAKDYQATLKILQDLDLLTEDQFEKIVKLLKSRAGKYPVLVREKLAWEEISKVEVNLPYLPGIFVEVGEKRGYVYDNLLSHVLGYVGPIDEKTKNESTEKLYKIPGIKIGKSGIEKFYDKELRGTAGFMQMEVNALGKVVRELSSSEPIAGQSVHLTLDINLQNIVAQQLEQHQSGSCVVMDTQTGAVYASVSHPAYNSSSFINGISSDEWQRLIGDLANPLSNKVISGQYSPGSIFKIMVALAAFENKVITPQREIYCKGYMDVGTHRFHCWENKTGHGNVDFMKAITRSCDCYFYDIAQRMSINQLEKVVRNYGFGHSLGIDLPGEVSGLIPTKQWKQHKYGKPWTVGDSVNACIGQGYVLSTPLQMAVMVARIANGGYAVQPRFLKDSLAPIKDVTHWPQIATKPEYLEMIKEAMRAVVAPGGTGRNAYIEDPSFQIGGKTATTQVRRITMKERELGIYSNAQRPWHHRDHGMFVAFGPMQSPRYAMCIVVDHGGSGSGAAAPLAKEIMLACKRLNPAQV